MLTEKDGEKSLMTDAQRKAFSSVKYTDFLSDAPSPLEIIEAIGASVRARDKRIAEYRNAKP